MTDHTTIVIFGASGDLALKKTFPSLYELYLSSLLPANTLIVGYARSAMTDLEARGKWGNYLKAGTEVDRAAFLKLCVYRSGGYGDTAAFSKVCTEVTSLESPFTGAANRMFYFAIPPSVFLEAAATVAAVGRTSRGWNRLVVEKPFGHDTASAAALGAGLAAHWDEASVYRIDHYLGKEMVQNLMVLRFANAVFAPLWSREHISTVQVTFKEPHGTEGRGGYFNDVGILRDVMQNHLLQVLSLVAMEPPVSMGAEDVRDEKVKVLKCCAPLDPRDVVLGQYGPNAAGTKPGYTDDSGVPPGSTTPTFASAVLRINNPRWHGVPFILKCGKALNERKAEVRIQFKAPVNGLFSGAVGGGGPPFPPPGVGQPPEGPLPVHQNELVIRIQPDEAVYLKLISRLPGMEFQPVETELALSYASRFTGRTVPDAYARLILDVLRGDQSQFVRADELDAAWRIFTPFLAAWDAGGSGQALAAPAPGRTLPLPPLYPYPYGSRGPPQSDDLIQRSGYSWEGHYAGDWLGANDPGAGAHALAAVRSEFTLTSGRLRTLVDNFLGEMACGLEGKPSSIKMIPSHVRAVPGGGELGEAWAIDLGGSNLRVLKVGLKGSAGGGGGAVIEVERKVVVPPEVQAGPGEALFDLIAGTCVGAGMPKDGRARLGFTFSFPYTQTSLASGVLLEWTKGFSASGVVGKDVGVLLEEALVRAGCAKEQRVAALANDTVGTLCAGAYSAPPTRVGVILGTGTNAAYMESMGRITKWGGERGGPGAQMAINMEWGGFGSGNAVHAFALLPFHSVDHELDALSPNPSKQRFEKMISGMYLGELVRRVYVGLVSRGALFVGVATSAVAGAAAVSPTSAAAAAASGSSSSSSSNSSAAAAAAATAAAAASAHATAMATGVATTGVLPSTPLLFTPGTFSTADMSECAEDGSVGLEGVGRVLERALGLPFSATTLEDRRVAVEVCALVAKRAARLSAAGVGAVVTQIQGGPVGAGVPGGVVGVAIDGSVFKKYPGFATWMREALSELGVACNLTHAEDGSGIGAAMIAVCAS